MRPDPASHGLPPLTVAAITTVPSVSLLFKIAHALDNLLLPYKIDLSIREQIDPELLPQIERLGISFYRRSKE